MRKMVLTTILLLTSSIAFGSTFTGSWTYETAWESEIEGFRLYDQDHQPVTEVADPTARSITWTATIQPGDCTSFYLVAYTNDEESAPSNIFPFCQPRQPLKGVGTFTIEFQ